MEEQKTIGVKIGIVQRYGGVVVPPCEHAKTSSVPSHPIPLATTHTPNAKRDETKLNDAPCVSPFHIRPHA